MKRLYLVLLVAAATLIAHAAAPNNSGTYYSSANGKKGAALKTAMSGIIYNRTEKTYNYLWTAFQTTDVRSDGKIWDMYSSITNYTPGGSAQGANYSKEGDSYNREHSFPQSWFNSNAPMYTDLHHIYPTDGFVNSKRSNFPFGETSGNKYKSSGSFSKLGACSLNGYTGTVFEPADEYKGDFARTYFYMVTCYEEKLADWYAGNADGVRATIDGSTYPGLQLWQLNMLLSWAAADPVSEKEIDRNTAVANIQGNRNPFIDYPGLEQYIWGSKKDDTFSYNNYVAPTEYSTEYNEGSGSGGGGGQGETTAGTDVINLAFTGVTTGTNYSDWSGKSGSTSSAVYAGNSAGGNSSVQLRSSNSNSGIVSTTSGGTVTKVKVTWNSNTVSGRTLDIYGKNTAYSAATNLYDNNTQGTKLGSIVYGTSTELTITDSYTYIGLRSNNGAMFLDAIEITWEDNSTPSAKTAPSFNNLSDLNVDYGSTRTLTKGTTGTENIVTDGTVTLTSSNEAVVTVDGLTITPVAVGTAIITISAAASENYDAGSTMAEITVKAPEGQTEAAPSTGGETDILLFGDSFGDNSGSARAWNDSYSVKSGVAAVYSGITDYTITNAKQSKNSVGSIASGLMQTTQGTDASIIIGPLSVADYSDLELIYQWKAGSTKGTYTTTAYYATSSTGSYTELTGSGEGATTFVERSYSLPAAAQVSTLYLKIVWNTSNTGAVIDEVQLRGSSAGSSATFNVTLNASGYATYCSEYPLDFSDYATADYSAWQITTVNSATGVITFSQITGSVKGGTGMLLCGTPGATVTLTSADSENELIGNLLFGTLAPTYVAAGEVYGLSGNQFVKSSSAGIISAGKAYLNAEAVTGGSEVKAFTFVFEDADGIKEFENEEFTIHNSQFTIIYNLAGQRINNSQLRKGIYIVNGKKVLVK